MTDKLGAPSIAAAEEAQRLLDAWDAIDWREHDWLDSEPTEEVIESGAVCFR